MILSVRTADPKGFPDRLTDAYARLVEASERGFVASMADGSLAPFLGFFPLPDAEHSERVLAAWRMMSREEKVAYDHAVRWDMDNVLYMLSPGMRGWELSGVRVVDDGIVLLDVSTDDPMSSWGTIRQLVEYAGGELVEDEPAALSKPRSSSKLIFHLIRSLCLLR